jgi:hypothetical protein
MVRSMSLVQSKRKPPYADARAPGLAEGEASLFTEYDALGDGRHGRNDAWASDAAPLRRRGSL